MSHTEPNPEKLPRAEATGDGHGPAYDGDINTRAIVWSIAGLIAVVVISMLLMVWMMSSMQASRAAGNPPPSPLAEANERWVPPGALLQEYPPTVDLETLRAQEDEVLSSYDWVDQEAGVVRIPVAEALRILEEGGLPEPGDIETLSDELFGETVAPDGDAGSEAGGQAASDEEGEG